MPAQRHRIPPKTVTATHSIRSIVTHRIRAGDSVGTLLAGPVLCPVGAALQGFFARSSSPERATAPEPRSVLFGTRARQHRGDRASDEEDGRDRERHNDRYELLACLL